MQFQDVLNPWGKTPVFFLLLWLYHPVRQHWYSPDYLPLLLYDPLLTNRPRYVILYTLDRLSPIPLPSYEFKKLRMVFVICEICASSNSVCMGNEMTCSLKVLVTVKSVSL